MAKRPRDPNQLAKLIVDIAIGDAEDNVSPKKKAVVVRGRSGGTKGGAARAANITPSRRAEIARMAAQARWNKQ